MGINLERTTYMEERKETKARTSVGTRGIMLKVETKNVVGALESVKNRKSFRRIQP